VVGGRFLQQEEFHFAPGVLLAAENPGGDDPGIVEDYQVARAQETRQLPELTVFDLPFCPIQDQHA
jgi:hypothetical protein